MRVRLRRTRRGLIDAVQCRGAAEGAQRDRESRSRRAACALRTRRCRLEAAVGRREQGHCESAAAARGARWWRRRLLRSKLACRSRGRRDGDRSACGGYQRREGGHARALGRRARRAVLDRGVPRRSARCAVRRRRAHRAQRQRQRRWRAATDARASGACDRRRRQYWREVARGAACGAGERRARRHVGAGGEARRRAAWFAVRSSDARRGACSATRRAASWAGDAWCA